MIDSSELNPEFEALLNYVKHNRGFDFTGYKRHSLMRRTKKRMLLLKIESFSDYMDYLEVHPEEFVNLFNTILINVTSFFRDTSIWDYISTDIIPQIVARQERNEPIRIWSAGCASGQEAYTLAMVLAEVLGVEQFRAKVKIYATDIDEEALNQARHAVYDAKDVASIPPELLEKYFGFSDNHYTFRNDLRRSVIFGRHDLVQDAPISRIDLLVCRNALIYFNAETQSKILGRFHFALKDGGFLFLGKAEMLIAYASTFTPVDLKRRIFMKVLNDNTRERLWLTLQNNNEFNLASNMRLRDIALENNPLPQLVVDLNGFLILANEKVCTMFGLSITDLNRPLQDLELSYRPLDLRSCIDLAYAERRAVTITDVEWISTSGDIVYFDVQFILLQDFSGNLLGISITFTDITRSKRLQNELEHSNQELEMAYEELQSTNEELETTNEELQSSNEELQTTNEELQSTNEELETMNEELQSSNGELQTINEELRLRSEELHYVNTFLESILSSLRVGVAVLNRDLHIRIWNDKAEDLWGLRAEEVEGQHFFNLDIGLPVEQLRHPIRNCLQGAEFLEVTLLATNRRGKSIQCKVACTPLTSRKKEIEGVIIFMQQNTDEHT